MARVANNILGGALFHDHAIKHDNCPPTPAEIADHPQVVTDKKCRHPLVLTKRPEKVEDRHSKGNVEHARYLIGHDQVRPDAYRTSNGHPLALPAGELVRVTAQKLDRRLEADLAQQPKHLVLQVSVPGQLIVEKASSKGAGNREPWVERSIWVLVNELDREAPGPCLPTSKRPDVLPEVPDLPANRALQPCDDLSKGSLATTRFPDQRDHFVRLDREADPVEHGPHTTFPVAVENGVDLDQAHWLPTCSGLFTTWQATK
jgi:hypothetical protein